MTDREINLKIYRQHKEDLETLFEVNGKMTEYDEADLEYCNEMIRKLEEEELVEA